MSHQFLLPPTSTQNKTLHHVPKGPKSRVARPSSVILLLFFWLADDASRSKPSVFDMTTTAGVVPSLPAVFSFFFCMQILCKSAVHRGTATASSGRHCLDSDDVDGAVALSCSPGDRQRRLAAGSYRPVGCLSDSQTFRLIVRLLADHPSGSQLQPLPRLNRQFSSNAVHSVDRKRRARERLRFVVFFFTASLSTFGAPEIDGHSTPRRNENDSPPTRKITGRFFPLKKKKKTTSGGRMRTIQRVRLRRRAD